MEVHHSYEGHRSPVYALVAGPSGDTFLSAGGDGVVASWPVHGPSSGTALAKLEQAVFTLLVLADQGLLVAGTEGGDLHVIDLHDRRELHCFRGVHHRGVFDLIALGTNRFAASGGDGSVSIWNTAAQPDVPRCRLERHIPLGEEKLRGLALAQDGAYLAVTGGDGPVRLLDTGLFNEHITLAGHAGGSLAVAFHPAKPLLISGGKDGHLRAWTLGADAHELLALPAHRSAIYRIACRHDGALIATAGRDKSVKLWDGRDLAPLGRHDKQVGGHTHSVNTVLWMNDLLLSAGDDRVIRAFLPQI